ncbi:hypothetical protein, partial [Rhodomicrobium udaipurense]|uniref:hypothetical protein n=1 Tax=Rhodomicrobium udaipurense TaxID=1202716 RepID=UPI001AED3679
TPSSCFLKQTNQEIRSTTPSRQRPTIASLATGSRPRPLLRKLSPPPSKRPDKRQGEYYLIEPASDIKKVVPEKICGSNRSQIANQSED